MNGRRRPDPALVRLLVFVGGLAALALLLFFARRILLPLLLGLVLAYLLDPPVTRLERRGWPRVLATAVIATALVLVLVGFMLLVVPAIGEELAQMRERLPLYRSAIEARVLPWLAQIRAAYPEQYDLAAARLQATLNERWPQMLQSALGWVGGIFSSAFGFLLFLLDLIFVPVFAFYLLVDFPKLKAGVRELIPVPFKEVTRARVGEVNEAVSSFLRGQLTIALILASINGIGLTLLDVPLGLVIGIVAGLANMIPYMSLVVGLAPALLLAWIEFQSIPRLLAVVAIFTGAQLLEGTVLSPRILGRSVRLHPVWVLLAIILGGRLFGLVGMLVAVPVAAAIQVFVRHWKASYRASRFFRGEPAAPAGAADGGPAPPGSG